MTVIRNFEIINNKKFMKKWTLRKTVGAELPMYKIFMTFNIIDKQKQILLGISSFSCCTILKSEIFVQFGKKTYKQRNREE